MTKLERAKQALNDVFSDTSKPKEETREDLDILRDELHQMIETLEEN